MSRVRSAPQKIASPCLTFEDIAGKRLDEYEYKILKHLCAEPEKGLESSTLQKLVEIDKVTFYKRLQRLNDDLKIIERLPYTNTGVKDRRKVYYRVRAECLGVCSELVAGFEIRQFLARTSFQSLDPEEPGAGRIIGAGFEQPIGMAVFSNCELNPTQLGKKFEDKNFTKALIEASGGIFRSLLKGLDNANKEPKIAVVFSYPKIESAR